MKNFFCLGFYWCFLLCKKRESKHREGCPVSMTSLKCHVDPHILSRIPHPPSWWFSTKNDPYSVPWILLVSFFVDGQLKCIPMCTEKVFMFVSFGDIYIFCLDIIFQWATADVLHPFSHQMCIRDICLGSWWPQWLPLHVGLCMPHA